MSWILFALLAPCFYALSAVIDNHLSDKLFRKTAPLIFYSFFFQLLVLPIVFAIQRPEIIPVGLLPFFLLIGLCEVLYLYPYYKALQHEDTAIVNSLWLMNRVLVPVGAYLFIGETLGARQYFGFFLIIVSSLLLTYRGRGRLKFNRSLAYMFVACLIISTETILYKYVLNNTNWSTSYITATLTGFLLMLPMLFVKQWRGSVISQWQTFKKNFHWLAFEGISTGIAGMSWAYAASLAPVSLVVGVGTVQPFAVLLLALMFGPFFPKFFKEKVDLRSLVKKFGLFALTAIGIYLIAG